MMSLGTTSRFGGRATLSPHLFSWGESHKCWFFHQEPIGLSKNTTGLTDIQTGLQKCEKTEVGSTCGVSKLDTFFHFQLCACLTKFLAGLHPIVIEGGRTQRKSRQAVVI